jgi:hypothetical protein
MLIDGVQNQAAEFVLFEEMVKQQDGTFIRQRVRQGQPGKASHGLNFVKSIFHGRIAKVVEQLHAMDAQHDGQRVSGTARGFGRAVFDERLFKLAPGNQLIHFFQKDFAASFALFVLVFEFGEGHLGHGRSSCWLVRRLSLIAGVFQSDPSAISSG